jgi:hypothetical protein
MASVCHLQRFVGQRQIGIQHAQAALTAAVPIQK